MKFSYNWLQTYFKDPLPEAADLAEKITFHSSEIEEVVILPKDTIFDVKVLPDKSAWLMSHRGLAKELSVILKKPLLRDSFLDEVNLKKSDLITIKREADVCDFYSSMLIQGITVKESPAWLKEKIEVLGQRSINNIVDATNYVMFELGQPLHAFDADKLGQNDTGREIAIRQAMETETVVTLGGEEIKLSSAETVIVDNVSGKIIGIAGIKGGEVSAVDTKTKNILLESAHFNRVAIRKSARRLKLLTDAAKRFENGISSQVAPIALRQLAELIVKIAGGEVVAESFSGEIVSKTNTITCSLSKINSVLNLKLTASDVSDILERFGHTYEIAGEEFKVTPTFERDDLVIAEDLIEDIGRIYGLGHIETIMPEKLALSEYNSRHFYSEKIRDVLVSLGFSEVYTSSFRNKDEVKLANALASDKQYLRSTLVNNLIEARTANIPHRDLLGLTAIKVFEIGTVFSAESEEVRVALAVQTNTTYKAKTDDPLLAEALDAIKKSLGTDLGLNHNAEGVAEFSLDQLLQKLPATEHYDPVSKADIKSYRAFSVYPASSRDVAMWVPTEVEVSLVESLLQAKATNLCVRISHLDTFSKEGRTSYAFRLVFQSFEKTLTDLEVQTIMDNIYQAIESKGWEAR